MTTLAEMTAEELRARMTANRWSVRALADRLGVPFRTVQRWRDGTSRVPPYLELALESLERRGTPIRTVQNPPPDTLKDAEEDHAEPDTIEEVERIPLDD